MKEYIERAAEMLCASTDDIQTVATLLRQIDALKAKVKDLEVENAKIKEILSNLSDLSDFEPCSLDHNGYCLTHNWFSVKKCPYTRVKEVVKEVED